MRADLDRIANTMIILSSLAVIGLCGYVVFRPRLGRPREQPPIESSNLSLSLATLPSVGSPQAVIGFVSFSDFECPYCAVFAREQFGQLKADFVDPGIVRYYWVHAPGEAAHKQAFRAAEASVCAEEQGRTLEMFQQLFREPMALDPEDLASHARSSGLNMGQFQSCFDEGRGDIVRRQIRISEGAGVTGTPTFFLGWIDSEGTFRASQKLSGVQPYDRLKNLLRQFVGRQPKTTWSAGLQGSHDSQANAKEAR